MKKFIFPLTVLVGILSLSACSGGVSQQEYESVSARVAELEQELQLLRDEKNSLENKNEETYLENKKITLNLSYGERTGIYTGQIKNGLPNGEGAFYSTTEEGISWVYRGQWANGHCEGSGSTIWDSGQMELGDFTNDLLQGDGIALSKDEVLYKDGFVNGQPSSETLTMVPSEPEKELNFPTSYDFSSGMYTVGKDLPQGIYNAIRSNDYSLMTIYYGGSNTPGKMLTDSYNNLALKNNDIFEITGKYVFTLVQ